MLAPPKPVEAPLLRPGLVVTLFKLWPYLWPKARPDLQHRVFLAFGIMILAKGVTMVTPFTFKWATDALVAASRGSGTRLSRPSRPASGRRPSS